MSRGMLALIYVTEKQQYVFLNKRTGHRNWDIKPLSAQQDTGESFDSWFNKYRKVKANFSTLIRTMKPRVYTQNLNLSNPSTDPVFQREGVCDR